MLESFSFNFWSESVWLSPNITWQDFENPPNGVQVSRPRDLWAIFPVALLFHLARFVIERYAFLKLRYPFIVYHKMNTVLTKECQSRVLHNGHVRALHDTWKMHICPCFCASLSAHFYVSKCACIKQTKFCGELISQLQPCYRYPHSEYLNSKRRYLFLSTIKLLSLKQKEEHNFTQHHEKTFCEHAD